uniref:Uncharacterized protein n=1 Tax=Heterorhabditis bacteriophora TaxID=37862 RepID=A0A1I7WY14_HETBA
MITRKRKRSWIECLSILYNFLSSLTEYLSLLTYRKSNFAEMSVIGIRLPCFAVIK